MPKITWELSALIKSGVMLTYKRFIYKRTDIKITYRPETRLVQVKYILRTKCSTAAMMPTIIIYPIIHEIYVNCADRQRPSMVAAYHDVSDIIVSIPERIVVDFLISPVMQ